MKMLRRGSSLLVIAIGILSSSIVHARTEYLASISFGCVDPTPAFDPALTSYVLVLPSQLTKLQIDLSIASDYEP